MEQIFPQLYKIGKIDNKGLYREEQNKLSEKHCHLSHHVESHITMESSPIYTCKHGFKHLSLHAGNHEVSRCHTRSEFEESYACR